MKSARAARPTVLIEPGFRRKVQGSAGSALRRIHMARYLSDNDDRPTTNHGQLTVSSARIQTPSIARSSVSHHAVAHEEPFTMTFNRSKSMRPVSVSRRSLLSLASIFLAPRLGRAAGEPQVSPAAMSSAVLAAF